MLYILTHIYMPNLANHFMREREREIEIKRERERERVTQNRGLSFVNRQIH